MGNKPSLKKRYAFSISLKQTNNNPIEAEKLFNGLMKKSLEELKQMDKEK